MDADTELERLRRLLGGPELVALRRRLRARYERGAPAGEFTLGRLSLVERRALEGLTGRRAGSAGSMRLRLAELDGALARAGLASSLRRALEILDGPVQDLKTQRKAREQAWGRALEQAQESRLKALIGEPGGAALLKRLAAGDAGSAQSFLDQAQRVLARLPAHGIPLAQLAAQTLGDSHALDAGSAVATLVLHAGAAAAAQQAWRERPREQWARLGDSVNELAAPALCLNLPVRRPEGVLAAGEPIHLSLRRLLRDPPAWAVAGRDVFVCENPSIVAIAADRMGGTCAPLVCTNGMPAAAQRTLLGQLAAAAARLRYHGDFDWPGLTIGNFVIRALGARAWRFGADDYLAACGTGGAGLAAGRRVEAVWDCRLAAAMAERAVVVHEEAVADRLMADLETDRTGHG